MVVLILPTIVLIAVYSAIGIHDEQPESCFLYRVSGTTATPNYQLKPNQDNYVTINHLFNRAQTTKIVNEDKKCVLQLVNSTSSTGGDGCLTMPFRGEYTTLGFRKREGKVFVNVKSQNESPLNISVSSLRVESDQPVNVAFDCPGNCFQFRQALIHARPKEHDNKILLRIYGLIEDLRKANNSELKFYKSGDWSQQSKSYLYTSKLSESELKSNEWIIFDIDAIYTHRAYDSLNYSFNVSVKTPQSESVFLPRSDNLVNTIDLYIDFEPSQGMRWAIHCQPRECKSNTSCDIADTQGGTSADGIKMEYFFAVVAVCGILVITTIILCCIIRNKGKQQQQQQTAHTSASRETTAAQEGNGQGAVYDYIDLQEFHNYLANAASEKSLADCHVDTNAMKAATSHTSINSIYGCGNDVENRNTDNGTIRRFSHTSENSLYGCHS